MHTTFYTKVPVLARRAALVTKLVQRHNGWKWEHLFKSGHFTTDQLIAILRVFLSQTHIQVSTKYATLYEILPKNPCICDHILRNAKLIEKIDNIYVFPLCDYVENWAPNYVPHKKSWNILNNLYSRNVIYIPLYFKYLNRPYTIAFLNENPQFLKRQWDWQPLTRITAPREIFANPHLPWDWGYLCEKYNEPNHSLKKRI